MFSFFLLFLLVGFIIHLLIRHFFKKRNFVDAPDGVKKQHKMAVPISGGLSFGLSYLLFIFVCLLIFYFDLNNFSPINFNHILVILFGIFLSSGYTYWAYFTVLQKFSVNVTSISVMAVPVLAILIDYFFVDVQLSMLDFLALFLIVTSIFVAATKPFNKNYG